LETAVGRAENVSLIVSHSPKAAARSSATGWPASALLRIAQIEGGARRERFAPVDVSAVLTALAEVYAEVAEDAGMTLVCAGPAPAIVMGDAELLTQMFANVIENAIRHCAAGTAIACTAMVQGAHVVATVTDNGTGIPAEARDLVLRRLYRLEQSRTTPGSGLGLSLVKAVADLHEAELALADTAPGLTVRLTFAKVAA
jgi:signal transduction histidine kinase